MNTNTTNKSSIQSSKDLAPKGAIQGCGTLNHNETLVRDKDLAPKAEIKGCVVVHERRSR